MIDDGVIHWHELDLAPRPISEARRQRDGIVALPLASSYLICVTLFS